MWICFGALDSVPLINVPVFIPIPYHSFVIQFKIRKHDTSRFVLSEDCFGYSGLLWLLTYFRVFFPSISVKIAIGILIGTELNLYIALDCVNILTIILLIYEPQNIVPFISVFFSCFHQCHRFQSTGLSLPWLNLFIGILFF